MRTAAALTAALIACAHPRATIPTACLFKDAEECLWLLHVKDAVGAVWKKQVDAATAIIDPTGCLYSTTDRRTVVEYSVAADGRVTAVRVVKGSGVDHLDRLAVAAFSSVDTLSPPPSHLVDTSIDFAFTLLAAKADCSQKPDDKPEAQAPGSPPQRR